MSKVMLISLIGDGKVMKRRIATIAVVACVCTLIVACSVGNSPFPTAEARAAASSVVPTPPPLWQTFGSQGSDTNQFAHPTGITVDATGHIYVSDYDNARIVRIDNMTGAGWTTFGTIGSGINQIASSYFIAVSKKGHIYFSDAGNYRIVRINDMTGAGWTTFGSGGSGSKQFNFPVDPVLHAGQIYISDFFNSRIVRIDKMTGAGWISFGTQGSGKEQFNDPLGIAFDSRGHIYITDYYNARIVRRGPRKTRCFRAFPSCQVGEAVIFKEERQLFSHGLSGSFLISRSSSFFCSFPSLPIPFSCSLSPPVESRADYAP